MFPLQSANSQTGYFLQRSLRFRASASAYLNRTPASVGNAHTWTYNQWVKRGALGYQQLLSTSSTGSSNTSLGQIYFTSGDQLAFFMYSVSTTYANVITTQVFRDPSAWYMITIVYDDTQATAANRVKFYVNGIQVTAFSTASYPTQNFNGFFNFNQPTYIGKYAGLSSDYLDGYLAEFNFIDGQALTPTSFGSYNSTTGVWQPTKYSGTYGTNGFYLPFTDNSALTTSSNVGLGKDFSGNGNYWTTNNISISSANSYLTYDSVTDVPTLTSATVSNYPTFNPLNAETGMDGVLANGNLSIVNNGGKRSTMCFPANIGKWYWETKLYGGSPSANFPIPGIYVSGAGTYYPGLNGGSLGYFQGGDIYYNGSIVASPGATANGDVVMFAYDATTGKIWVGKNGTWLGSGSPNPATGTSPITTMTTGLEMVAGAYLNGSASGTININFGQIPFSYTVPAGFVALNTYNLPDSTIKQGNKLMDATLWTGNGSTQTIINAAGFKPDLVWYKARSFAYDNSLFDSVRGATNQLSSNLTQAETSLSGVTAFNSNGFSLGSSVNGNGNTTTYVGWQWQAGQGTNTTNTNGTITSTVSVNTTAGFSVVTYTGNNVNGATVGHGLGVTPSFFIIKPRTLQILNGGWSVYHQKLTAVAELFLNTTDPQFINSGSFNNTSPTSSVFTIGTDQTVNTLLSNYVAYCWAEIPGFSKFGSYVGNGASDGVFVYLGFRPKLVMIKGSTIVSNWSIYDSVRDTYNVEQYQLVPNSSGVENTNPYIDFLSNGFKIRTTSGDFNSNGQTYVFAAFASNPFKNSLAR